MSASTTATMTSTLPQRQTRPPQPPPMGPLPALPIPKTRKSLLSEGVPALSAQAESSASSIPKTPQRAVTTSGLPTPKPAKSYSTPAVPTLSTTSSSATAITPSSAIPTPGKPIRKTTSIGAFPHPPKSIIRVNSLPPSPLSASTSPPDVSEMPTPKTKRDPAKHRSSESAKRVKTRSSGYGLRSRASMGAASNLGASPSLLNGTGESNLISSAAGARGSDSFLSLPSPPQSRSSSADDSYHTDGTQFEESDGEFTERGRPKSQETVTDGKRHSNPKDAKGNVVISVRVRPDAPGGDSGRADGEWMVDGRRSLISYRGREGGDYRYDNVFSPHDHNARVYDNSAKRLVRRVMEGYHGTVFAYGMTGTGKTFTMQGTAQSPGVIPLAITDIFSYIRENPNREFLLRVSYLEIYNEKIYDLLSPATPGQEQDIKLREDGKRGVYATPLKEEIVQSPNQLLRVIARGDLARRTGSTQFNARSSRSHAVVQIVVESRERTPTLGAYFEKEQRRTDRILPGGVLVSTLSLIDLAGSERAAESKERRTEGAHINKSLLTLGTVIARLSGEEEKGKEDAAKTAEKDKEKGLKHLPYRDSKLTRLLQPALSGDSLVSILCTIQLSSAGTSAAGVGLHAGETLNTLKFASRAKNNIVSHAKRNESNPDSGDAGSRALLDRYRIEIQQLRAQLEEQNQAKEAAERKEDLENDRKIEEELERQERNRHEEQMLEMQLARTALKERISHLNRLILSSKSLGVNSGRFSSASVPLNRMSTFSVTEFGRPVSVRSRDSARSSRGEDLNHRDSNATLEVPLPTAPSRTLSVGSITTGVLPVAPVSQLLSEDTSALDEEEEEADLAAQERASGDGEASLAQQNRMLQADLADKTRYIHTLEKRLYQARRTSHSRASMQFSGRAIPLHEDGSKDALLREKDREIDDLRARLDDQTKMVQALRSAARKRDVLDDRKSAASEATARPPTVATGQPTAISTTSATVIATNVSRRTSSRASTRFPVSATYSGHMSNPSTASRSSSSIINFSHKTPLSPVALLSPAGSDRSESNDLFDGLAPFPSPTGMGIPTTISSTAVIGHKSGGSLGGSGRVFRRKSVDEMTMLLDQMIQDKVESGHVVRGERGSLRVKRDTVMENEPSQPGQGMIGLGVQVRTGAPTGTEATLVEMPAEG